MSSTFFPLPPFEIMGFSLQYGRLTTKCVCMDSILLEKPLSVLTRKLTFFAAFVFFLSIASWVPFLFFQMNMDVEVPEVRAVKTECKKSNDFPVLTLSPFEAKTLQETLFLPEFVNSIHCYQRPPRPDRIEMGKYFSFKNAPFYYLKNNTRCFLSFTSQGFVKADHETPLSLTLLENGTHARLDLSVVTPSGEEVLKTSHTFPTNDFPGVVHEETSDEFVEFCKRVERLELYPPDVLFAKFGVEKYKEKGRVARLGHIKTHIYPIDVGGVFTLQGEHLVPLTQPENAECFLVRIKEVELSRAVLQVWDKCGKEYREILLRPKTPQTLPVRPEDLFKDIRVRGRKRALVKLGKKTKLLHPGDFLIRRKDRWELIDEKEAFQGLLNYMQCGMLFVFEGIVQKGKESVFAGHLFDETRSTEKRVELPVKVSKQKSTGRARREDAMNDSYDELPPELEELLEELDDL